MSHYVGLDISMKETVICIVNDKGESVHKGRCKTDPEKITCQRPKAENGLNQPVRQEKMAR